MRSCRGWDGRRDGEEESQEKMKEKVKTRDDGGGSQDE